MSLKRSGLSIGVVTATVAALLLLVPGPSSEHLKELSHDHEDSARVAIEAVHTTLPAHFDASSTTREHPCSACMLQGPQMVRFALVPGNRPLLPAVKLGSSPDRWRPAKRRSRRDLSRAPPTVL